ncbi:MAG: hypothetical protein L6Q84_02435 [Polyangiaceae bacterium]|nr:hypothetical protein [Polyangiaceae bacterium]
MAYVEVLAEGTTGPNQSVFRVFICSKRRVSALIAFLPEGLRKRPDVKSELALADDEKEAVMQWLRQTWPSEAFVEPPDFWVLRTTRERHVNAG